jgi:hypothetical protein
MKINLLRIEEQERSRGRGFMKRMKEAWDSIYEDKPMSAQCLRDNAARFRKDKAVANLIEVRDRRELEPDQVEQTGSNSENSQSGDWDAENDEDRENVEVLMSLMNNGQGDHENKQEDAEEREGVEENEDEREMQIRFMENLNKLSPTTNQNIEERDRLIKIKVNISETELANANKVLEKHLSNTDNVYKIVDAMYAMGRTIKERMGIKRGKKKTKKTKKKGERDENRGRLYKKVIKVNYS